MSEIKYSNTGITVAEHEDVRVIHWGCVVVGELFSDGTAYGRIRDILREPARVLAGQFPDSISACREALEAAMPQLTTEKLREMLTTEHNRGYDAGAEDARAEVRKALGID